VVSADSTDHDEHKRISVYPAAELPSIQAMPELGTTLRKLPEGHTRKNRLVGLAASAQYSRETASSVVVL